MKFLWVFDFDWEDISSLFDRLFHGRGKFTKDNIQILFVDDEVRDFDVINNLKEAGWSVVGIEDIKNVDEDTVKRSQIIFVDYKGVGRSLSLKDQLIGFVSSATLPQAWKKNWLNWLERDKKLDQQSAETSLIKLKFDIQTIDGKLNILLDSYLDGTIDSQTYKQKKNELFTSKQNLESKIAKTKAGGSSWLEPMEEFINCALQAQKVARPDTPSEDLRIFAKNIGSNYFLKDNQLSGELKKPFASLRAWAGARAESSQSGRNFFEVTLTGCVQQPRNRVGLHTFDS